MTSANISSYMYTFNTEKLGVVLKDVNEKLQKEGILNDRLTLDIWTKLMSSLMQGEYDLALPVRHDLQRHMRLKRQEKIHTFKSIIQKLDQILDRYIPPPDLGRNQDSEKGKTEEKKKKKVTIVVNPETPSHSENTEPVIDDLLRKQYAKMDEVEVAKETKAKPLRKSRPEGDTLKEEFYLLKANESVLMKTVEDQQMKIKRLQETTDTLERHNMALKDDMTSITSEQDGKIGVCSKAEKEIKFLRKELEIKEKSLEMSMLERSNLLDRLSVVTSAKLTSSNSSLSDRLDMNRPTKMAEKHLELYEHEWADAFHLLTLEQRYDRKTAILLLLDILQDSYTFCENTTTNHTQILVEDVLNPFQRSAKKAEKQALDDVGNNLLTDLKKVTGHDTVTHVQTQFLKKMHASQKKGYDEAAAKRLTEYIDKCVELCWYMVLQTPPLCLDDDRQVESGAYLDRDVYRFYTIPGSKIDFIVWPALFLSQNGIVLSKGVAQAKQEGVALRISSAKSKLSAKMLDEEY